MMWILFALAAVTMANASGVPALPPPSAYDAPAPVIPAPSYNAPVPPPPLPVPTYNAPAAPVLPEPSLPAPTYNAPLPALVPTYNAPAAPVLPAPVLPAPTQSYGVPVVSGPYNAPAPLPTPSYGIPVVPAGPYGAPQQPLVTVTNVPGREELIGFHNQFYAPMFKNVYVPLPTSYAPPAPAAGYGVPAPAPSSSYGVPVTPPGPYGSPAPAPVYAAPAPQFAIQRKKIGDAVVNQWLSQKVLQGGGRITETKVKDGYNGYRTIVNEEWLDQKPYYNFGYDIKSKLGYGATPYDELNTSAQESRHGYTTSGSYSVKQPDGRTRIVQYTADANGFMPVVTYV